ncbi:MAG: LysM peptidoglycan-binding domain-containing protein [Litorilinea sp.]
MNSLNGVPNKLSPDDIFEQAIARLEKGEAIDAIIATYPTADGEELRDFLIIIQATQQIRTAPIPEPTPARRTQARQNFLAAAAELRSQSATATAGETPNLAALPSAPARQPQKSAARARTTARRAHWLTDIMETLRSVFSARTLRLAPMILVLAVVLLSTTTLVTVAQTAVPGDLTYTLKQWIRKHELELAPADQRALVRQMQETELAEDVRRAALRADTNATVIQAEDTQVFYGRTGRVLRIGGLTVLDRYQPDANEEIFAAMTIEGDLASGALVELAYQIMPGQSDTVQGITLNVISPPATPEVTADPTSEAATPAAPAAVTCSAELPADWVTYQVQAGDNLTFIANRGNISVAELMAMNCLENETLLIGATLFVPTESTERGTRSGACAADIPTAWGEHGEYEVQVGDNLSRIAQQTGTTIEEIKAVNCLTSDTILIGATLLVPESVPAAQ